MSFCHCIIVYFNAVRSFDRKSEINHQFSPVDVINCAEFFIDRFRGIDFVGVEICLSPQELKIAVNIV